MPDETERRQPARMPRARTRVSSAKRRTTLPPRPPVSTTPARRPRQDPQGPTTPGNEADAPEDLKVVVSIKGGRATIGVQKPSSDPHIESFDDHDLTGLAQEALAVVERAKARWEDEPKHPAHVRPAPPARRRAPARAGVGPGFNRRGRGSGGSSNRRR